MHPRIDAAAVVENGIRSWSLSDDGEEQVIDNCDVWRVQSADVVRADRENFTDRLARSTTSFATGSVV